MRLAIFFVELRKVFCPESDLDEAEDDQARIDQAAYGQQEDDCGDGCEDFVAHRSFPLHSMAAGPISRLPFDEISVDIF